MIGPRVQGTYDYDDDGLRITTDSGQEFDIEGDGASRAADGIDVEKGAGDFDIAEGEWNDLARGSFR